MRLVTVEERASILRGDEVFDVAETSGGSLPSDPLELLADHWDSLQDLASRPLERGKRLDAAAFGSPIPSPPLVLAVIANYPPAERGPLPMIVGKAPSAVRGPYDDIILPDPNRLPLGKAYVVPEPELAIITFGAGRHLTHQQSERAIAGYSVAQDVTERFHEFGPGKSPWTWEDLPAKTLGKSLDTFCPLGPALVTPDELQHDGAFDKRCWINDEIAFDLKTETMLWSPVELVSLLSAFMSLRAGTVVLCGSGGLVEGRHPTGLAPGDRVRTEITGIGELRNQCRAENPD